MTYSENPLTYCVSSQNYELGYNNMNYGDPTQRIIAHKPSSIIQKHMYNAEYMRKQLSQRKKKEFSIKTSKLSSILKELKQLHLKFGNCILHSPIDKVFIYMT